MTKMPVQAWAIAKLIPYEKNAKKHPPEQIKKLAGSIKRYGITPLQIKPTGEIITGHGRRLAAIELGLINVPVIVRSDLSEVEADALRIADNQVVSNDYDIRLLGDELVRLSDLGLDADMAGMDAIELERLLGDGMDAMADGAFADDINTAVADQKRENTKHEAEIDTTSAPLSDAFGFKRVTVEQGRAIRSFMTAIETKTGCKGIDALMTYFRGAH